MRIYDVYFKGEIHKIYADEIGFKNDFFTQTPEENLVFFEGTRLVAIFKTWDMVKDCGEYSPSQTNQE